MKKCTIVSKYKMLCKERRGILWYHAGALYWSKGIGEKSDKICELAETCREKIMTNVRLFERLMRMEPRFAVPYNEHEYLLSWTGSMYLVNVYNKTIKRLYVYRTGMNNPLSIVKIEGIENFESGYVFGEYWGNASKQEIKIYCINENGIQCKYTFAPGVVQHIHGITVDQVSGRVLICTGDKDEESGIWEATNDFMNVEPILIGTQQYRTCAAYVTEGGILYATDTPLCDNAIYLYNEDKKKMDMLYHMPGPCIYSARINRKGEPDMFVFATSVEPDSTLPDWRYRITYRLGTGVKSRRICLVIGNLRDGFRELLSLEKDFWPMWLFQFGNISFPIQDEDENLYFTPVATKKSDGKTLNVKL